MNDENRGKVEKTDAEWREKLSPEQYRVTRQHGTEMAFSHPYNGEKRDGVYRCTCCGAPLFASADKFDSGTGWPSYTSPIASSAVTEHKDRKLFMTRTEVRCASCDGHLGHVFPDGPKENGPQPTVLRYCINGAALDFSEDDN